MQGDRIFTDDGKSQIHQSFAGRVSRALATVLAGPTTELQPSPQFLKRSLPLLGCFFC
jgi:hypothetical protein